MIRFEMKPPHHPIIIIRLSTVLDHHLEPPLGIPQQAEVFLYQVSILLLLITTITIITILTITRIIFVIILSRPVKRQSTAVSSPSPKHAALPPPAQVEKKMMMVMILVMMVVVIIMMVMMMG